MKSTIIKLISNISEYITAKRISVAVCIVLYITTFFTTAPFFPENSESVLSISVSVAFIISFYVMTAIVSPSKRYLVGFSIYFALVALVLLCVILEMRIDGILSFIALAIIIPYLQPISQFYESVLNGVYYKIFSKTMGYNLFYFALLLFIVLFYIVYFTSWYLKRRKEIKVKANEEQNN